MQTLHYHSLLILNKPTFTGEISDTLFISGQQTHIRCRTVSSVQFSRSDMSNSLGPHGLQYARLPCPSPTPGTYSNSCPLSWWCHPTISSSVVPSPPAFNHSQHQGLFQWVSSSHQMAKVLEFHLQHSSSNEYSELISFRMTGWISLQSKGLSRVFSNTTVQKHQFFGAQLSL